jgi:hypothetical protein
MVEHRPAGRIRYDALGLCAGERDGAWNNIREAIELCLETERPLQDYELSQVTIAA